MGSEVVKGCEGGVRITIMVFLVVTLGISCAGFGLFEGIPEEQRDERAFAHIALFVLSLIFLIGVSTWYLLIFKNKVKYGPKVRKCDGITALVVGVLFLVVANICAGVVMVLTLQDSFECSKCKGTRSGYFTVCGIALASLDIALLLGTILGCKLCCGGDGGAGQPQPSNAAQQSGGIPQSGGIHPSGGDGPQYADPQQYGTGQAPNQSSIQSSQPI